jgi:hypothetical protein
VIQLSEDITLDIGKPGSPTLNGKVVDWMEKVTEEQYLAAVNQEVA